MRFNFQVPYGRQNISFVPPGPSRQRGGALICSLFPAQLRLQAIQDFPVALGQLLSVGDAQPEIAQARRIRLGLKLVGGEFHCISQTLTPGAGDKESPLVLAAREGRFRACSRPCGLQRER